MKKIRNSGLLKVLCYILIPFLVGSIFLSMIYISMRDEFGYTENDKMIYTQTENFGYNYLSSIINIIDYINYEKRNEQQKSIYNEIDNNTYYNVRDYGNQTIYSYIKYIIIDNDTSRIYTNLQSNNYQSNINEMNSKDIYWTYENENISTNIDKINSYNARYMQLPVSGLATLKGYNIYTYIDTNAFKYSNIYSLRAKIFDLFKENPDVSEILIPVNTVLLIIIASYLIWSIGHKKNKEGITLNSLDKFPYELLLGVFFTIVIMCIVAVKIVFNDLSLSINLMSSIVELSYFGAYTSLAIIGVSTIKRLKAKEFLHSFLIYKIYKKIKDKIIEKINKVLDKSDSQKKLIILYIVFILIIAILGVTFFTGISLLLLIAFLIWTLYKLLEYNKKLNNIKMSLKEIYEGNKNVHINTEELKGTLKELSIYVNDISNGFSNAIEESLKSERLKTELITNVSHDIKTPLTSIINYVDLIKQENIEDEKVKEYIKVLEQKTQRLKKLTEDLIEASKASSGSVQLNIEEIDLNELLKQVTGEFEDKFKEKNLLIELNLNEKNSKIQADNRYMYRIIENLFSNVAKYAMDNTRVYINLINTSKEIKVEIKNVSKDKLNISAEELMQRFVRGDKSRYTEGSGLGLSIAKSLTELQKGEFNIEIDGDLFKAILVWTIK